eukprot:Gb_31723 [translate_table: standard]
MKPQFNCPRRSPENGAVILEKLWVSLKDILKQLEIKDKMVYDAWKQLKQPSEVKNDTKMGALSLKPGLSFETRDPRLAGISLVAGDMNVDSWCYVITTICQRLVIYLNKETQLQKWAISLEKEALRLLKMEKDISEAKAAVAEQSGREDMLMKNVEEARALVNKEHESLAKERENLAQWITHLQEQQKVPNS